ncbi:MAG: DUF6090 family protein [Bacteroidales bacterium]
MNTPLLKRILKKALHYLGEIAVVIIGIVLAVQLNNLNEKRKNEEEGKQSLRRIAAELAIDQRRLDNSLSRIEQSEAKLKRILYQADTSHLDSMVFFLFSGYDHFAYDAEYINLKYSGKLHLIQDEALRNRIVRYYEGRYTALQRTSDSQAEFSNNRILPYFSSTFPSDTTNRVDPALVLQCLDELAFRNLIVDQIGYYMQSRDVIQRANPGRILDMIRENLDTQTGISSADTAQNQAGM